MTNQMAKRSLRARIAATAILALVTCTAVFGQRQWSDWSAVEGSATGIEYRWRASNCLPVGCFKDVQFRNSTRQNVLFDYTIWSEGARNKGDEVKDTGTATIPGESSTTVVASGGGERIKRVIVAMK